MNFVHLYTVTFNSVLPVVTNCSYIIVALSQTGNVFLFFQASSGEKAYVFLKHHSAVEVNGQPHKLF